MPKNTCLIENYKKVEEIKEINTEIPSYEEFLNNYNQEQTDYSDLTYEDISSNKVYGPCSWNNPNCECYLSQGFVLLKVPCPIDNCRMNITNWFHSNNGYLLASSQTGCGTLVISSDARIKCSNCGIESSWKEWKFSCPNRQGIYSQMDVESFIDGLSHAAKLYPNISSSAKRIMFRLVQSLMENY